MDSIKALPCFAKQWHQKEFVLRKGQKIGTQVTHHYLR